MKTSALDYFNKRFVQKSQIEEGAVVWTVDAVSEENFAARGEKEDLRLVLFFKQSTQGLPLNYGNTVVMVNLYGEAPAEWTGKDVELFVDAEVIFDHQKVGGIRLRAPSGPAAPIAAEAGQAPKKMGDLSTLDNDLPF